MALVYDVLDHRSVESDYFEFNAGEEFFSNPRKNNIAACGSRTTTPAGRHVHTQVMHADRKIRRSRVLGMRVVHRPRTPRSTSSWGRPRIIGLPRQEA